MRRLRRISIGSAFAVSGALYALLFAFFGLFTVLLPGIIGLGSLFSSILGDNSPLANTGGGIVTALILYVVGIVLSWLFGGISGAITAFVYNIVAGFTGGLRIQLDEA